MILTNKFYEHGSCRGRRYWVACLAGRLVGRSRSSGHDTKRSRCCVNAIFSIAWHQDRRASFQKQTAVIHGPEQALPESHSLQCRWPDGLAFQTTGINRVCELVATYLSRFKAATMAPLAGWRYLAYKSRCLTVTKCLWLLASPTLMTTVLG